MIFNDFIQSFVLFFTFFKVFYTRICIDFNTFFMHLQTAQPATIRRSYLARFFFSLAQPMYSAKTQKNSVLHFC